MIIHKAALRPVPRYAVIEAQTLHEVEEALDADEELQHVLDRGFTEFDRRQPALATWLSDHLARTHDELVQSLGYFLTVTVYMAFREAFPTRLVEVEQNALDIAEATLDADEELRRGDPTEILDSDDVLAISQPAMVAFVQHHVDEAIDQAEGELDVEELELIYRCILVMVIAFSHSVRSPTGQLGPSPEMLA